VERLVEQSVMLSFHSEFVEAVYVAVVSESALFEFVLVVEREVPIVAAVVSVELSLVAVMVVAMEAAV
jgi:hypothetical protein